MAFNTLLSLVLNPPSLALSTLAPIGIEQLLHLFDKERPLSLALSTLPSFALSAPLVSIKQPRSTPSH